MVDEASLGHRLRAGAAHEAPRGVCGSWVVAVEILVRRKEGRDIEGVLATRVRRIPLVFAFFWWQLLLFWGGRCTGGKQQSLLLEELLRRTWRGARREVAGERRAELLHVGWKGIKRVDGDLSMTFGRERAEQLWRRDAKGRVQRRAVQPAVVNNKDLFFP